MSRYQDTIIAALLIGLAGLFAYETSRIAAENFQRAPGMVYYPLLLSGSLAAASLVLFVRSLARRGKADQERKEQKNEGEATTSQGETAPAQESETREDIEGDGEDEQGSYTRGQRILPVLLGVAILAGYALALAVVGFILSTPVMLVALLLAYGVRSWKVIAFLSVGVTAVIYLSFYYLLSIQLP